MLLLNHETSISKTKKYSAGNCVWLQIPVQESEDAFVHLSGHWCISNFECTILRFFGKNSEIWVTWVMYSITEGTSHQACRKPHHDLMLTWVSFESARAHNKVLLCKRGIYLFLRLVATWFRRWRVVHNTCWCIWAVNTLLLRWWKRVFGTEWAVAWGHVSAIIAHLQHVVTVYRLVSAYAGVCSLIHLLNRIRSVICSSINH